MEDKYAKFCKFAEEYLHNYLPPEIKIKDLENYYEPPKKKSLYEVYESLIYNAQNYQSMPNIIKWEKRYDKIKRILCDFDFRILKDQDAKELYYRFRTEFNVTSEDKPSNSWLKWSKTIVDGAKFMDEFATMDDFNEFLHCFEYNLHTRKALPLLIQSKIHGFGFALACETLKEIGCNQYPKPDVHTIRICSELGFCENDALATYDAMLKIADCGKITPAKLDKILWLISSGKFYLHGIDKRGEREEFITMAKKEIGRPKLKLEDFDLSDKSIFDDKLTKEFYGITVKEAVQKIIDILEEAGVEDWAIRDIVSMPYVWGDILKQGGREYILKLKKEEKFCDLSLFSILDD